VVLAAGVGVPAALAGCGGDPPAPAPPPGPDPLQPVLDEALALAAAYDRAALVQPGLAARLRPLAADHRAHAAELAKRIGPSSPPSAAVPSSSAPARLLAGLRTAERAAQQNAAAACRTAPADRAALLGSIAACRATHAEALR
jgi:hypothetical protein